MRWIFMASAALLGSCAAPAPPPPPVRPVSTPAATSAPAARASGPIIDEAHARVVLNESFRNAGLRVLADVDLEIRGRSVTVDGFDPDRRIGFEYSASEEQAAQRDLETLFTAETGPRILVLAASDEATVRERASAFLARQAGKSEPTR